MYRFIKSLQYGDGSLSPALRAAEKCGLPPEHQFGRLSQKPLPLWAFSTRVGRGKTGSSSVKWLKSFYQLCKGSSSKVGLSLLSYILHLYKPPTLRRGDDGEVVPNSYRPSLPFLRTVDIFEAITCICTNRPQCAGGDGIALSPQIPFSQPITANAYSTHQQQNEILYPFRIRP